MTSTSSTPDDGTATPASTASTSNSDTPSLTPPDTSPPPPPKKTPRGRRESRSLFQRAVVDNLFVSLLALRLLNAFTVATFFQPDEYYQSLEPAWALAFADPLDILSGRGVTYSNRSGAWLTWEWKERLRSSLHPILYGIPYLFARGLDPGLLLPETVRVTLLLAAPKVMSAFIAAVGDYYTILLARNIFGHDDIHTQLTLLIQLSSAWQWFFSTRSFSNGLEMTLTTAAIYHWPFQWACAVDEYPFQMGVDFLRSRIIGREDELGIPDSDIQRQKPVLESTRLWYVVILATLATLIRPTSAIIWLTLLASTYGRAAWHCNIVWEVYTIVTLAVRWVPIILTISAVCDRLFYGIWTFPLYNFFRFNVARGIATFYGTNQWHHYLSQGLPLLLLLAVVPFLVGAYHVAMNTRRFRALMFPAQITLYHMLITCAVYVGVMSVLSHKEVRFVYPLLPLLHIVASFGLSTILGYTNTTGAPSNSTSPRSTKRIYIAVGLLVNIAIAYYTTRIHQSGVISVPNHIRSQFTTLEIYNTPSQPRNLTFAVLMPCHSMPWRSHLQYPPSAHVPGISGWALTCEPPLHLAPASPEREMYVDEADVFYTDPTAWLLKNMASSIPQSPPSGFHTQDSKRGKLYTGTPAQGLFLNEGESGSLFARVQEGEPFAYRYKRAWPDYLVFFEQAQPRIGRLVGDGRSAYQECATFKNTHWHDDWRRRGRVLVWCLHQELGVQGERSDGRRQAVNAKSEL